MLLRYPHFQEYFIPETRYATVRFFCFSGLLTGLSVELIRGKRPWARP